MSHSNRIYKGPIYPIVTPFKDDGSGKYPVDYDALEVYVKYLLDQGARIVMVASATSRFAQLEIEEIKQVNEFVIKTVGQNALAIASTPIQGPTYQHLEVAQHAESIGATDIACEYPWRYQNDLALIDYYNTLVSGTDSIRLMIHVTPGRSELGGQYRYDPYVLKDLCSINRVQGMKEASGDSDISKKIWNTLGNSTDIIVAGKGSRSFLDSFEDGVSGFFVGTGSIMPGYSEEIYHLVLKGDLSKANELVEKHEMKFLTAAKKFGWHAALKAGLAEMDLMQIIERPPMAPISVSQRAELAVIMRECGWGNG